MIEPNSPHRERADPPKPEQPLFRINIRQNRRVLPDGLGFNLGEVDPKPSPKAASTSVPTASGLRPLYALLGYACLAIGFVNQFIPGLPSTVFYLVALWAFKRSSPKLEHWLLWKSPMGPVLRDWEESRSMTVRTKILALTGVWVGIGSSIALIAWRHRLGWLTISGALFATAVALTIFLLRQKTKVEDVDSQAQNDQSDTLSGSSLDQIREEQLGTAGL